MINESPAERKDTPARFKITRKSLLIITASIGVLLIVYSLVRHFFGFGLPEKYEKHLFDGVVIAALGCFMYNRKLARDEKAAREEAQRAAEDAERRETEGDEPEEITNDDNIPHWERNKKRADSEDDDSDESEDDDDENEE